jgi:hypothetical protein
MDPTGAQAPRYEINASLEYFVGWQRQAGEHLSNGSPDCLIRVVAFKCESHSVDCVASAARCWFADLHADCGEETTKSAGLRGIKNLALQIALYQISWL